MKFIHYFLILLGVFSCTVRNQDSLNTREKPNFIIIYADDLGYGDLACFGAKKIKTPNFDKMADGGMKFTEFYSSSPVCSPSRAALMTGC